MTRPLWFLLSLVVLLTSAATIVWAQQPKGKGTELKISDTLGVRALPGWRLSNQTRDSLQVYVPLKKVRPPSPKSELQPYAKPEFVVASEAGMQIAIERRRTHAEALQRLADIASERPERATFRIIAGWPAIERRYRAVMPRLGQAQRMSGNIETLFATTAVAVADTVIRFETMLAQDAGPKLVDEAFAIGRSLSAPIGPTEVSRRELQEIQKMVRPPGGTQQQAPVPREDTKPRSGGVKEPGIAVQARPGRGELEVATNDGQHVVVAANSGRAYSDNFGASFSPLAAPACTQTACNGDPSLAVGFSGAIYYAWIEGPSWSSFVARQFYRPINQQRSGLHIPRLSRDMPRHDRMLGGGPGAYRGRSQQPRDGRRRPHLQRLARLRGGELDPYLLFERQRVKLDAWYANRPGGTSSSTCSCGRRRVCLRCLCVWRQHDAAQIQQL